MKTHQVVVLVDGALTRLADSREELRDLDAALGDGDLGITVAKGCEAIQRKLAELVEPNPAMLLRVAAAAFSSANPSTFAALVGGALLAAARALGDADEIMLPEARMLAHSAADSIIDKGKSNVGDKTVLDALMPSIAALDAADSTSDAQAIVSAMVDRARDGLKSSASLQSRRGRAAWLGERSMGHLDAGATAYVRFLESLHAAWGSAAQP